MVTKIYDSDNKGCPIFQCYGLSTDSKPTDVTNASTFFEMDTGKVFIFDKENETWHEI